MLSAYQISFIGPRWGIVLHLNFQMLRAGIPAIENCLGECSSPGVVFLQTERKSRLFCSL